MPILKSLIIFLFLTFSAFAGGYNILVPPNQSYFTKLNLERIGSDLYRLLDGDSYTYFKVRSTSIEDVYFSFDTEIANGVYRDTSGNYYSVESEISLKSVCSKPLSYSTLFGFRDCYSDQTPDGSRWFSFQARHAVKFILDGVATCKSDENYNSATGQCQKCDSGQSWNPKTNSCFVDCTDINKNKFGFTDGSCADCSGEKDSDGVKKCYCNFIGSSRMLQSVEFNNGNFRFASCQDGSQFWYKVPGTPDSDDNKTKPDTPTLNPGGNATNPGDPNNPNQGGGNQGGNQGGNNGANQGNNTNPKPGNGNSTNTNNSNSTTTVNGNTTIINNNGGGNKNGDDPKFNKSDFDDSDLEKERNGLYDGIKSHILDNLSKFDGIRDGINQFVNNVQGKGFEKVQPSIKGKCPIKKQISLPGGKSQEIVVDYCENLAPVSEISYYAFYAGFAIGGFILILKLFIFSF